MTSILPQSGSFLTMIGSHLLVLAMPDIATSLVRYLSGHARNSVSFLRGELRGGGSITISRSTRFFLPVRDRFP